VTITIIRARRRYRFAITDQRVIEDRRLSWAARGLFEYVLGRPDDWRILVDDLRRKGDLGRDGIYALLKELRRYMLAWLCGRGTWAPLGTPHRVGVLHPRCPARPMCFVVRSSCPARTPSKGTRSRVSRQDPRMHYKHPKGLIVEIP